MKKYFTVIAVSGVTLLAAIMLKNADTLGSVAMWSIFLIWDIILLREACKELK